MALKFNFYKTPKHRVFRYNPIYWDQEKDERDDFFHPERNKKPGQLVRGSFQKAFYNSRRHPKSKWNGLIRIIIILSIVALFVAAFYFSNFMEIVLRNVQ